LDVGLPVGLLAFPAFIRVIRGTAYIQVIKLGSTAVGTLDVINVVNFNLGVTEMPSGGATVSSQMVLPSVQQQIESIDL